MWAMEHLAWQKAFGTCCPFFGESVVHYITRWSGSQIGRLAPVCSFSRPLLRTLIGWTDMRLHVAKLFLNRTSTLVDCSAFPLLGIDVMSESELGDWI